MTDAKLFRQIQSELDDLAALELITPLVRDELCARYPTTRWNLQSLARWFTLLGVGSFGAGVITVVFSSDALRKLFAAVQRLLHFSALWECVVRYKFQCGTLACLAAAYAIIRLSGRLHARRLIRTATALELLAALAIEGAATLIVVLLSTGSGNWPALVGLQAIALIATAYSLNNRWVLAYASVHVFVWFGGETGYVSGWGAYFLGMNYPLRFLLIGSETVAIGYAHIYLVPRFTSFSRVYLHFGLLVANFALWFLSLFGYFGEHPSWNENAMQRVAFSALWAATSVGSMLVSTRLRQRVFFSYGIVFLIVNAYTFYFQFVAKDSEEMWWLHLLLIGGSLTALGFAFEKRHRSARSVNG